MMMGWGGDSAWLSVLGIVAGLAMLTAAVWIIRSMYGRPTPSRTSPVEHHSADSAESPEARAARGEMDLDQLHREQREQREQREAGRAEDGAGSRPR